MVRPRLGVSGHGEAAFGVVVAVSASAARASWGARARLRAAMLAAGGRERLVGGVVGCSRRSAAGGGERFEFLEGGEQLLAPWPVVLQS